jgi:hypothetical protein
MAEIRVLTTLRRKRDEITGTTSKYEKRLVARFSQNEGIRALRNGLVALRNGLVLIDKVRHGPFHFE